MAVLLSLARSCLGAEVVRADLFLSACCMAQRLRCRPVALLSAANNVGGRRFM